MARIFPYTLKSRAKIWFNELGNHLKREWDLLKAEFLACFEVKESTQNLLEALQRLQQHTLQEYEQYERAFFLNLSCLDQTQEEEERLPECVLKHYFVNGLVTPLRIKVICERHDTLAEAVQAAQYKYRSMMFKLHKVEVALSQIEFRRNKSTAKVTSNVTNLKVSPSSLYVQNIGDYSITTSLKAPMKKERRRKSSQKEFPQTLSHEESLEKN